jgi:hypothetical protein
MPSSVIISLSSKNQLGYYLAGLIEGDGTFYIPKAKHDKNGKLRYPRISIVFPNKDIPLAYKIISVLKGGTLTKTNGNYKVLFIQDLIT